MPCVLWVLVGSSVADCFWDGKFILYWTERQVPVGGRVVVSEHEGFTMSIGEHDEMVFVRYGFRTPNQPRGDEMPGWHEDAAGAVMADESNNLLRITM
jgi:hypothetical protein